MREIADTVHSPNVPANSWLNVARHLERDMAMSMENSNINDDRVPRSFTPPRSVGRFSMQCGKAHARRGCSMAAPKASRWFVSAAKPRRPALSCLSLAVAFIPASARTETIETEHLFGFTIGSDVGEVGERELEGSVTGRFSKRTGIYDAGSGTM